MLSLSSQTPVWAVLPQPCQFLAMTPAKLDPDLTQPWPSWFLQPQHKIRTLGWVFHHPQACLPCPDGCCGTGLRALPCLLCCSQSWGCDPGLSLSPRTTKLDPKHPQTLIPSPPPALLLSLNSHAYPTPGCKWCPAPFRFSSGLWWHLAGGVGRVSTPTASGYY